jgi:hypothetical protein
VTQCKVPSASRAARPSFVLLPNLAEDQAQAQKDRDLRVENGRLRDEKNRIKGEQARPDPISRAPARLRGRVRLPTGRWMIQNHI